jgi:hypothetical protein
MQRLVLRAANELAPIRNLPPSKTVLWAFTAQAASMSDGR